MYEIKLTSPTEGSRIYSQHFKTLVARSQDQLLVYSSSCFLIPNREKLQFHFVENKAKFFNGPRGSAKAKSQSCLDEMKPGTMASGLCPEQA